MTIRAQNFAELPWILLYILPSHSNNICICTSTQVAWVYETQKQLRETQVDGSVHAVSIDRGIRTPQQKV
ncbi:hypothetical protein G9A89_002447 [Geosiphon pyriformis]|nr:hypothetical protein G9A89_002447 [Geosiphon pyriformis]